jgi:hypothetical protein
MSHLIPQRRAKAPRDSVNEAPACREYLATPKKIHRERTMGKGGSKKKPPYQTDDKSKAAAKRRVASTPTDNMNALKSSAPTLKDETMKLRTKDPDGGLTAAGRKGACEQAGCALAARSQKADQ